MTECRFKGQVWAFAEGRLSGTELSAFEKHLAECEDCRKEVKLARKLEEVLVGAMRDDEAIDVRGRVEAGIKPRRSKRHLVRAAVATLAAASVLLVLWATGIIGDHRDTTTVALDNGTAWLMRTQEADGHWDARKHGSGFDFDIGVTGLSVLALAEANEKSPDVKTLEAAARGAQWLVGQQDRLGRFLQRGDQSRMYGQAVATLAILRVYEKSKNEKLRGAIESALAFEVRAQSKAGGWSYVPGITADTSHTGWFVLALAQARGDGFEVPDEVLASAMDYVNGMTDAEGRVSYDVPGNTSTELAGTSIAVNATVADGIRPENAVYKVVKKVAEAKPDWNDRQRNLYMWFFASKGFKHINANGTVASWQRELTTTLVAHQERKRGAEFGSWSNNDTVHADAGRVYATSLALVCLSQSK